MRSLVAKLTGWVLGSIGLVGGFASYVITTRHLQSAPLAANHVTGQIHPYFVRGVTIYLDGTALAIETYLFPSMAILCLLGGALLGWVNRRAVAP